MTWIAMRSQRRRLVDEALDAYAGWRDQCGAVELAYSRWCAARGNEAEVWFAAFAASLDREERAAERYGLLSRRVGTLAAAHLEPMRGIATATGSWP